MKKTAHFTNHGYTLFEILVAVALLAITLGFSFNFILTVKTKSQLNRDAYQLIKHLEYSKNQSIAGYKGHTYSLIITSPNQYHLEPEGTNVAFSNTQIQDISFPYTITFNILTGETNNSHKLKLVQGKFYTFVSITDTGYIDYSPIKTL